VGVFSTVPPNSLYTAHIQSNVLLSQRLDAVDIDAINLDDWSRVSLSVW
jgi:hypothetical protein